MENIIITKESEFRRYSFLLYGLVAGIIFDIFFNDKTMGISYPVFIIAIMLLFLAVFKGNLKKLNNWSWLFAVPALLLSLTFFIYSNQVFRILNYLLLPLLLMMFFSMSAKVNKYDWSDIRFIADIARRIFVPFRFIHRPFTTFSETSGSSPDNPERKAKSRTLTRVLIGLLISIPLIAIILWLLFSADIVFKNYFTDIPLLKIFRHFIIIVLVTIYSAGFAWTLKKAFNERQVQSPSKKQWKLFLDPVVLVTILVLINVIYAVFSFVQFAYLFGGNSFILPSSFTFAEYARRGFAELVVVSIINFAILIFALTFVRKQSNRLFIVIKSLLALLVISTFVILASAFYRMVVYENAYGFTYLRIFVQAFMVMLFFLFVINIIYIWLARLPIIKSYIIVFLAVYIVLNFSNVDEIIAKNNIRRYFDTGNIDMAYLKELSFDAIPEMNKFYLSIKNSEKFTEKQMAEGLSGYFNERMSDLKEQKTWQSFNLSRHRAELIINMTD